MKPTIMIIADKRGQRQVAIERGMGLAARLGHQVMVAGFVYENLEGQGISGKARRSQVRKKLLAQRRSEIQALIRRFKGEGVKVSNCIVWEKNVCHWVVAQCRRDPYALVVKTGHRSETFMYSSTDWQLLRECPAPVMITAEKKWRKTKPIVAAVDLGSKSRIQHKLNHLVIDTARQYAEAMGCEIYVLYAIHISPLLTELDLVDGYSRAKKIKQKLQGQLQRLSVTHGIQLKNFRLKQGPVDKVITSESARLKAQLVVMGTVGRKGVRAKLIGNTAEEVLSRLRTDVLALKL
ncbi:MAG: universal stress protein [Gammaproteobacteria bacterium]|nr:universal stress protein [Gammaproteobacteria bacterium]